MSWLKFNPTTGSDTMIKHGAQEIIQTRHLCITVMNEYENKSIEELRFEDYAANRKGKADAGNTEFVGAVVEQLEQLEQHLVSICGSTAPKVLNNYRITIANDAVSQANAFRAETKKPSSSTTSLMPKSFDDKSYQTLRKKFNSVTSVGNINQSFWIPFNRMNESNSVEKNCIMNASCKFLFVAKFECTACKKYAVHWRFFDMCKCGEYATISFSVSNSGVAVRAQFDIGIEKSVSGTSIKRISKETKRLSNNNKFVASFKLSAPPSLKSSSRQSDFFSTDGIIVFVLSIATEDVKPASNPTTAEPLQHPGVHAKLAEQFSESYINVESTPDSLVDFTIYVGSNKIHCHKLILSLTSRYFSRMFESNMKEANTNQVNLEDIDLITLKSVIEFMYTNSIDDKKITVELLNAADRFEVMRLREICSRKLRKDINAQNVATLWEAAYIHNIEDLTHDCVVFMAIRWKSLVKDEKIIQLTQKYAELLVTISLLLSESNIHCT